VEVTRHARAQRSRTALAGADLRGYETAPERKGQMGTRHIDDDCWQIEAGQRANIVGFDTSAEKLHEAVW
jgi:hypothetical protein